MSPAATALGSPAAPGSPPASPGVRTERTHGTRRYRRLGLRSAAESGSGEAAPRRPLSFLQALRSSEDGLRLHGDRLWSLLLPLRPWIAHSWLIAGDNRERGEQVGMSPNSLLQSCLGFAVRSAKQMGHRKRPGARSLVRRASEHGRMGEREMQPHPDSEGTRAELVILCLPPAIRICPGGVYAVKLQLGHRRRPDGQTTLAL